MSHPLEQKLERLQHHARRTTVARGWCMTAAVMLAAVAAAGSVDCLARLEDRGLRVFLSLAVIGAAAWGVWRFLAPAWRAPRRAALALGVERAFPRLRGQLLSAIEFLGQADDDPTAGSATLRHAVVARTAAEAQDVDFDAIIDRRPAKRAISLLAMACLAAAMIVCLTPVNAATAIVRLLNPFGATAWPRANQLMVRRPVTRLARGATFRIEVVDARGARLPANARIHYRDTSPEGDVVEESEPMPFADGRMIARRENVQRTFSYRVEGGDDRSMPWTEVAVVEPPAVETLSVRLIPPAYTGWPATPAERAFCALAGTEVRVTGRATVPLAAVVLCLADGRRMPAKLGGDGRSFAVGDGGEPWIAERSGDYWFELTDREGVTGGADDRWEAGVVADAPPKVAVERPASNRFVVPTAVVPIRVVAKDDIAIRDVSLVFQSGEAGPTHSVPLFVGPKGAPRREAAAARGDARTVDHRWQLATLKLRPGEQVTFHAAASDYRPQTMASEPRRLTVVTPEELQERLATREKLIVSELQRALGMQRDCRAEIAAAAGRLAGASRIERADVDRLQAAEHGQREVDQLLTSRGEGVPMHIAAALEDMEINRLDDDARRPMSAILAELERLGGEDLPPLAQEMSSAVKTAQAGREGQGGAADLQTISRLLASVGRRQDAIAAVLQRRLALLAHGDSYRRFQREIGQLLHDQQDIAKRTSEVGRRTLTRALGDLKSKDAADLKDVTGNQLELARSLDRTLQEMEQAGVKHRRDDSLAADAAADAAIEARRLAVADQMRTAAEAIRQNQIGQAAAGQKQIAENLASVLDVLDNRRRQEADRLARRLREIDAELATLDGTQEAWRGDVAAAGREDDPTARKRGWDQLATRENSLRQEASWLAENLDGLQAEAAHAVGQSGEWMDHAARGAGQGDADAASRAAANARLWIAEARRRLAGAIGQALVESARERLARLGDDLQQLRKRQQDALDETQRLHAVVESKRQLTRAQMAELVDVAGAQRSLEKEAAGLGRRFAETPAIASALDAASADMREAAGVLEKREAGRTAQEPQRRAIQKLDALVQAAAKPRPSAAGPTDAKAGARADQTGGDSASASAGATPGNKPGGQPGNAPPPATAISAAQKAADAQEAMKRLWGALPERARQQMLQLPPEEWPAKYQQQIEEYFRRLAKGDAT